MTITSSKIIKFRDKGNGRLSVFEQHTDDKGKVYEHRYSCPVGHDIKKELLNWASTLETTLAESEKQEVENLQRKTLVDAKMQEVEVEMLAWEAQKAEVKR